MNFVADENACVGMSSFGGGGWVGSFFGFFGLRGRVVVVGYVHMILMLGMITELPKSVGS